MSATEVEAAHSIKVSKLECFVEVMILSSSIDDQENLAFTNLLLPSEHGVCLQEMTKVTALDISKKEAETALEQIYKNFS